jgi:hypothetical protein
MRHTRSSRECCSLAPPRLVVHRLLDAAHMKLAALCMLAACIVRVNEQSAGPAAPLPTAAPPPAAPPVTSLDEQFEHSQAELDELVRTATAGYAAGPTIEGRFEKLGHLLFPMVRGRCYVLVLRFHDDARISPDMLSAEMRIFVNKPDYLKASGPMFGHGAVLDLDCVMRDGTGAVGFKAIKGRAPGLSLNRAGDGGSSLTLYERPLPESELPARQRAWEDKVRANSEASNRSIQEGIRENRADACRRCAHPAWNDPVQSYDICLQRQGMTRRDCS